MVTVDRPHVALHQRVAAELKQDVVTPGEVRESGELLARTRKVGTLIAILQEQLASRLVGVVQLPGAEQERKNSLDEGDPVLQRHPSDYRVALHEPLREDHGDYADDDDRKQSVLQDLDAAPLAFQLRHLGGEIAVLALDPLQLNAARALGVGGASLAGLGAGNSHRGEYMRDETEAAKAVDA